MALSLKGLYSEVKMIRIIEPVSPFILVKPIKQDLKTASGIYKPDAGENKATEGIVQSISKGITKCKKGDVIGWKEYSGAKIDDLVIVDEEEVLYIVKDEKCLKV